MKKLTIRQLASLPVTASSAAEVLVIRARAVDLDALRHITGGGDGGRVRPREQLLIG